MSPPLVTQSRRRNDRAAAELPPSRFDSEATSLGERLRRMRLERSLTINGLARETGVPASTISKIENGLLKPSLVNAINLASALGENLGFLIDRYRGDPRRMSVVRARDRSALEFPEMGLALQDLSGQFAPGVLEARYGILKPGANSGRKTMSHPGEEICCVIRGAIRYQIASERSDLAAGDVIQFKSDIDHRWENASRGRTEVIWVFSNGLSF